MATAEQTHSSIAPNRTRPRPPPGQYEMPGSEAYRSQAGGYDQRTEQFQHWRELLIDELPVGLGETVLDVGCGTGLCLRLLHEKVGPTGTIIGVDASEQMLQVAADRVTESGTMATTGRTCPRPADPATRHRHRLSRPRPHRHPARPDRPGHRQNPGNSPRLRTPDERHSRMIILGIILLILGFVFGISILWTIGIILIVAGAILAILGATGRVIGGRKHWY